MSLENNAIILTCPNCTRAGSATWVVVDAAHPRKLHDLSAGFLSIDGGSKDGPRIVCQKCRIRADEHAVR